MKNKLELTWVGKYDNQGNIESRILIEDKEKSYGDSDSENMLIHGDNLLALKALEQKYSNSIKCIYIDPPYNTGNAFEHYDDNLEHSIWLNLMSQRLQILHNLLSDDGVIFISIDDDEYHYLKVLCDEIFSRKNYTGTFIWEKKKKPSFLSNMGVITEYVLSYAKNKLQSPPFVYGKTTEGKKYPINNAGNGVRKLTFPANSVTFGIIDQTIEAQDMSGGNIITKLLNDVVIKDGRNENDFTLEGEWRYSQEKLNELIQNNEKIFISKIPFRPNHIKNGGEPKKMKNLLDIAHYSMKTNEDATKESEALFGVGNAFTNPKPEMLISTLIQAVTEEGDIVLDSFLGSGTTCAVAHKLKRKWIGIELGDQCYQFCKVRMDKVVDGEQGGISTSVNWHGGGGYKFYELAPTLIKNDMFGEPIINKQYNEEMLARAVALHENFIYDPSDSCFWKQSKGTENSFLYVTTSFINSIILDAISEEIKNEEFLLIACTSFEENVDKKYNNIKIIKIPEELLDKCKYDVDNYDLNTVENEEIEDGATYD